MMNKPTEIVEKRDILSILDESAPEEAHNLMGKVLTIGDLKLIPNHQLFRNPRLSEQVDETINNNSNILFHPLKMQVEQFGFNETAKLLWHGRGEDGRIIMLIVDSVYPLLYIRCPDNKDASGFKSDISKHIGNNGWNIPNGVSYVMARRIMYFEADKKMYARIQFGTLNDYYNAKKYFKSCTNFTVAGAEHTKKKLHLQITREHPNMKTADPFVFKYIRKGNPYPKYIVKDIDVFVVKVDDIIPLEISMENARPTEITPQFPVLSFDCETGSPEFGMALDWQRHDTKINDIGGILSLNHKHLFHFTITTSPDVKPIKNCLVITCTDQLEMILIFGRIIKLLRPAIETGYNTWGFDWPFIFHKLNMSGASEIFFKDIDILINDWTWLKSKLKSSGRSKEYIDASIAKRYIARKCIKIGPDDKFDAVFPDMMSFSSVDLLPQFRKKNNGGKFSSNSLNFWLKSYGLKLKYDMPYSKMHDIYIRQLAIESGDETVDVEKFSDDITELCLYCVFDNASVLDLIQASGILLDLYMLASINNCTICETTVSPIATLVLDSIIIIAHRKGYLNGKLEKYSSDPRGMYPGAKVLPPQRGLTKAKLTIRERMNTIKSWKIVTDDEAVIMESAMLNAIDAPENFAKVEELSAESRILFAEFVKDPIRCPVSPWDFKSMYPYVMKEGNLSMETGIKPKNVNEALSNGYQVTEVKRLWSSNRKNIHMFFVNNDPAKPETNGIIHNVQFDLLDRRNAVRSDMKKLAANANNNQDEETRTKTEVMMNIMESKQKLLKVSMNSVYGKMKSVMYEIACETTFGGVDRLNALMEVSRNLGWNNIIYGDTDSIYVEMPSYLANDIHALYYGGKMSSKEYNSELVKRVIMEANTLTDKLNNGLRTAGYKFMTVGREEVLWPLINICKKKYVGAAHDKHPEFKDDGTCENYTIRKMGARLAKGSSLISITLGTMMYKSLLNIYNVKSYKEIAIDIVKYAYDRFEANEWPAHVFVNTATYRGKQNSVTNFVNLMIRQGRTDVPKMHEKFRYVFVRKDNEEYNEYGNKCSNGRAGIMELYDVVQNNPGDHSIDFGIYMEKTQGCLGELICVDPSEIRKSGSTDEEMLRLDAKKTTDHGKKFVEYLCALRRGNVDSKLKKKIHVSLYKAISSSIIPKIKGHYHEINRIYRGTSPAFEVFSTMLNKLTKIKVKEILDKSIKNVAITNVQNLRALKENSVLVFGGSEKMDSIKTECEILSDKLFNTCKDMDKISTMKRNSLYKLVGEYKKKVGLDKNVMTENDFSDAADKINELAIPEMDADQCEDDINTWRKCVDICRSMTELKKYIQAHVQYTMWLDLQIDKCTGCGIQMSKSDIDQEVNEIVENIDVGDILNI